MHVYTQCTYTCYVHIFLLGCITMSVYHEVYCEVLVKSQVLRPKMCRLQNSLQWFSLGCCQHAWDRGGTVCCALCCDWLCQRNSESQQCRRRDSDTESLLRQPSSSPVPCLQSFQSACKPPPIRGHFPAGSPSAEVDFEKL